jgi:hypothetical protein
LLKAAAGAELKLMLPMVTEVNELRLARELLNKEVRHLSRFGHQLPRSLQFGAMLEVPSLLWQLDELMEEVTSFPSVPTTCSSSSWQLIGAIRVWPIVSIPWAVLSCGCCSRSSKRPGERTPR